MINSVFAVARSGIEAESHTAESVAANIAHMNDTIRPAEASTARHRKPAGDSDAYRPQHTARFSDQSGGVRTAPIEQDPPHELSYAPSDPNADENGLVARPSISVENEFVTMMLARRALQANISSVRTADAMLGAVLNAKI